MSDEILIQRRFRGPPESGNGGYVCGLLSAFVEGPARVRLERPPPLERALGVREDGDGVGLFDGAERVAFARPCAIELDPPASPGFEAARAVARQHENFDAHWLPDCFVCGPKRAEGDGLCVYPGWLDAERVASPFVPDASLADADGRVAPEFLWAALDCPGAFSFRSPPKAVLLGELQADLHGGVEVGERCVILGWELAHEGRKHRTATVLYGESGSVRGVALATWIELAGQRTDAA